MFTDSQNARLKALSPNAMARTRHIDTRYKWITDRLKKGTMTLEPVGTREMAANGLKKCLEATKHNDFIKMLGIKPAAWVQKGSQRRKSRDSLFWPASQTPT